MADLDRRYAQGTTVGRTEAGVVDQGLRAYMIRVYNYMATGVAITGVLAYVIYALSVQQGAGGLELTSFGTFMFASPFKWVVIFAPARDGIFHLGAHHLDEPQRGPDLVLDLLRSDGRLDLVDLPGLCRPEHRAGVLHHRRLVRRAVAVGLHHQPRSHRLGLVPVHGSDRHHPAPRS